MEVPLGLKSEKNTSAVVCRLKKTLYGLRQAPRCWNRKCCNFLKRFKFKQINADECIFYSEYEGFTIRLALFVDDGLIACKSWKCLRT